MTTPLAGLRVVDDTDDSGRFATKLLTGLGADVVRISRVGSPGIPLRSQADGDPDWGLLDWWYDGGKRRAPVDITQAEGRDAYRRLVAGADLVIETRTPGDLSTHGIDHGDLLADNPALVQVSITPFGRTGPRAHWQGSDLVAAALGGFMSVTGLPDRPLNVWGRQAYNYAGFVGALSGLAAVRAARHDGRGRHIDLSIHETVTGSIENIFMQWFFDDLLTIPKRAARQGALHWLRAYDLAECRTGYTMITPTPTPQLLVDWMLEEGNAAAVAWDGMDPAQALAEIDDLMDGVRSWVKEYDAMALWWTAQERHVAFGGVHDIPAVTSIPQFEHRGFWVDVPAPADQAHVRMPQGLVRFSDATTTNAPPEGPASIDELLAEWGNPAPAGNGPRLDRPLDGVRVADFTWVLAGPFATRMLGDLGADVVRIQNEERATIVNSPDFPYYFVWNRSKRSASIDMKHPDALAAVRRLIENCDILIENYSAGVLDRWGLDWETVHRWNPRLVYVTMSGCGHDGPWRHVISYAPTVHAVCGITHLTNFEDRGDVGSGFSLNDHLAGFAAAVTAMAALHQRDRTGTGQKVDMAQLEVGTYCIGPAVVEYLATGIAPEPHGNRDGLVDHVPNEVYPTTDGFLAVTITRDEQWPALIAEVGDPTLSDPAYLTEEGRRAGREHIDLSLARWAAGQTAQGAMEALQERGVPAGRVQDAAELATEDPQHEARGFWIDRDHPVFGPRRTDTFPALVDGQRLEARLLSPAYIGEHNFEVWTELAGFDPDEVAEGMGDGLFA